MSKIAVVYWSGTGNTEAMANAVVDGVKAAGVEVELFQVDDFNVEDMANYGGFAFGCPAMGDEVLEEDSFEPFFADAVEKLDGVPVLLFGSYGWGGGAWMETWADRAKDAGAKLVGTVIAENAPDEDAVAECENSGKNLAKEI